MPRAHLKTQHSLSSRTYAIHVAGSGSQVRSGNDGRAVPRETPNYLPVASFVAGGPASVRLFHVSFILICASLSAEAR